MDPIHPDAFGAEVLHADKPVLVDFYADWCGPCRALSPTVKEVAAEMADRIKVVKLNVDAVDHNAPEAYSIVKNIRAIPTLMIFNEGKVIATHVGGLSKPKLKAWIENALNPSAAPTPGAPPAPSM